MQKQTRLGTFLFKACPRCHGDLALDQDEESTPPDASIQYVCLECGRRMTMAARRQAENWLTPGLRPRPQIQMTARLPLHSPRVRPIRQHSWPADKVGAKAVQAAQRGPVKERDGT